MKNPLNYDWHVLALDGHTGVELADTFAELTRTVLNRNFRRIDSVQPCIIVIVVDGTPPFRLARRPCHPFSDRLEGKKD